MADLVTHVCTGLIPAALFFPRATVPLAIGTVLPDLTGRVPQMGLVLLKLDTVLPETVLWMLDVAHTPVAQLCLVVALAQGFRERWRVGGLLAVGVALHFALDVLQDHHGNGYYLWFPFSTARWEAGLIGSEATVAWAPWIALFTLIVLAARHLVTRFAIDGRPMDGAATMESPDETSLP